MDVLMRISWGFNAGSWFNGDVMEARRMREFGETHWLVKLLWRSFTWIYGSNMYLHIYIYTCMLSSAVNQLVLTG